MQNDETRHPQDDCEVIWSFYRSQTGPFLTICPLVDIYVRTYIRTYLHIGLFRSQIEPVMNNLHTLQSAKSTQDWAIFLPKDLVAK